MALYRCAACGSPNVMTDTQAGGIKYNYLKGAVGTVVLGAGGATAGIQNKSEQVFKCPDCGVTLTYPMPEEIKLAIDIGVMDETARKQLKIQGVQFPWEYFTEKYKNIESGLGDKMLKMKEAKAAREERAAAERLKSSQSISQHIAVRILDHIQQNDAELTMTLSAEELSEQQRSWEAEATPVYAMRDKAREEKATELAENENAIQQERQKAIGDMENCIEQAKKEHDELSSKLAALGIFKISEKQKTKQEIEKIAARLSELEGEKKKVEDKFAKKMADNQAAAEKTMREFESSIAKKYPLRESPEERKARIEAWRSAKASDSRLIYNIIFHEMIRYGVGVYSSIWGEDIQLVDIYDSKVNPHHQELLASVFQIAVEKYWGADSREYKSIAAQGFGTLVVAVTVMTMNEKKKKG